MRWRKGWWSIYRIQRIPKLLLRLSFPIGLTVVGNVWFLAGGQTVQAYDIRQPANPQLLASFKSVEAFPTADDNAHDLVYRDGYLYATSQGDHGLVILKVNDVTIQALTLDSTPNR